MKTVLIVFNKETGVLSAYTTMPNFTKGKDLNPQSILNSMSRNKGMFENKTYKIQRLKVNQ